MEESKKEWRLSVSLTKEQEEAITKLRQTDEFCRCSFGELIRKLIDIGLEANGYPKG